MSFKWRGLDRFVARTREAEERFEEAMVAGVTEVTAEVQGQSTLLAPVDEGTLRASHSYYVDGKYIGEAPPTDDGDRPANRTGGPETRAVARRIRGVVGANTEYAAVQHELVGARHPRGGEDKFMEKALRKTSPFVKQILRKHARRKGF